MNKYLKYTLKISGIFIIFCIIMIVIGLHGMEIEDHYGGLQEIYYKSNDNDIVINETTKEYGIVDKSWKNIHLWTKSNPDVDLYYFAYKNGNNFKLKVYRFEKELPKIKQLNYKKIIQLINDKKPKLIFKYNNEYDMNNFKNRTQD